ncbi:MAG TPA: hypothetical protein VHT51_15865 [Micropepsaceae bacterium]|jgi:hypothetical protein|nr:hypothetical protein [Micropepsaceae bacterium]
MSTTEIILLAILAIVVVAIVAFLFMREKKSRELRDRFGPEYVRTLAATHDKRKAELSLEKRAQRVKSLRLRSLNHQDRQRYVELWRKVQNEFVDDPSGAFNKADDLLGDVMAARGYPMSDFEHQAADLSVNHPFVVQHYRAGHEVALRHRNGEADTEELRRAMIHYRDLFDELVNDAVPATN